MHPFFASMPRAARITQVRPTPEGGRAVVSPAGAAAATPGFMAHAVLARYAQGELSYQDTVTAIDAHAPAGVARSLLTRVSVGGFGHA